MTAGIVWAQQSLVDWQQQVRENVRLHRFDEALGLVNQRLVIAPADMEARGWRGRLLAWEGQWAAAEAEYRSVLAQVPNDTEIAGGLADVLLWQGRPKDALSVIDHARELDPTQPEILLRRARILQVLERTSEARNQYRELLRLNPENQEAKTGLASLAAENKHELRIGSDASTFNYTGHAQDEALFVTSHWTSRCTTAFAAGSYQRFGQYASEFLGSSSFRITGNDSLTIGAAAANHQSIIPRNEAFFEYGHGWRFSTRQVKGLEVSYQQRWWWYEGAHVLTLSSTQLYYLPRDWTWSITATGARSGFTNTGIEWVPSGSTRLAFPLPGKISGNVEFANGTEDFAQVDQIGHFSARTFAGSLKCRFTPAQDVGGYVAVQHRSDGQTQNSFGANYGFRF